MTTKSDNANDIRVLWKLEKIGSAIEVHYSVESLAKSTIYLLDQPVISQGGKYAMVPERSIVQRGSRPHLVKFTRGFLRAESQMPEVEQGEHNPIQPVARALPAGGRLEGAFQVPLPIAPWHPTLEMAPIRDPEQAVLEIGYLTGNPEWRELPTASGTLQVPTAAWVFSEHFASGEEKPLPRQ